MSLCPKCQKPMQQKIVDGRTVFVCHLHGEMASILNEIVCDANDEFCKYAQKLKK